MRITRSYLFRMRLSIARLTSFGVLALLTLTAISATSYFISPQSTASAVTPPDSCFAFNVGTGTITNYYDNEGNNGANPACPRSVDIPSTIGGIPVTAIGNVSYPGAFTNKNLTSVTIPSSVTSIGDYAFNNNQLTSVTIHSSVTSIGNGAFSSNQLTSLTIPNSVTSIGGSAFSSNQLTSLTIPISVTSIGGSAFSYNQLTTVMIPISVNNLGASAFKYNKLTSATVVGNPATIGDEVFDDNRFLTSISYNGTTYTDTMPTTEYCFKISSGVVEGYKFADLNAIKNHGVSCLSWDIVIPAIIGGEAVTSTGTYAFRDSYFRSVVLPSGLISIGNTSFANNRITHVTIPSSVTSIDPRAFFMQSKWGGYIEYDEPGIPYLYSDDPSVVQEIYDNFWYVQLTTEDPLNPSNLRNSVINEDWYLGDDANANGVDDSYGGHLINPASVKLQYVNSTNTSLRTSLTFTGKLGDSYLANYLVTQGPTVPMPANPYSTTPEEQTAIDNALSAYYRIGDSVTIDPPAIDGYITPITRSFVLGASTNNFSYVYASQSTGEDTPTSTSGGGDADTLAQTGMSEWVVLAASGLLLIVSIYPLLRRFA